MEYQERDYLISLIRTGIFLEGNLKIVPATLEQIVESHYEYQTAYSEALDDQLMTNEDLRLYMEANGLWNNIQEQELMTLKGRIDNIKLNMYNDRANPKAVEKLRKRARAAERSYAASLSRKNSFYSNSCEAFADSAKMAFILRRTTYINNKLVEPDYDSNDLLKNYNKSMHKDSQIRELARSEPWRSLWIASKHVNFKLMLIDDKNDLTMNQRNLILWSTTYDNIQEAYEPPEPSVVEDDDLLDGWFVYTRKKREEERRDKAKEKGKNNQPKQRSGYSRTGGKTEEFILVNQEDGWDKESITNMNSPAAAATIKSRFHKIKDTNELVSYDQLPDIQEEGYIQAMKNMKDNRRT